MAGRREQQWWRRAVRVVWGMALVAFVASGCALVYATANDVSRYSRILTPTPAGVATDLIVRDATDHRGRRTSFRILLFSDEHRWRLSSYQALEEVDAPSFTPEMRKVLDSAREIICVGASSEELPRGLSPADGRRVEEARAGRRAERIALWVRNAVSNPVVIRKLNVGHHTPTGGKDTSDQRRVVIVLVLDREEGADIDEALRSAMRAESSRAPVFDALLTRYSLSSGERFTWVE